MWHVGPDAASTKASAFQTPAPHQDAGAQRAAPTSQLPSVSNDPLASALPPRERAALVDQLEETQQVCEAMRQAMLAAQTQVDTLEEELQDTRTRAAEAQGRLENEKSALEAQLKQVCCDTAPHHCNALTLALPTRRMAS